MANKSIRRWKTEQNKNKRWANRRKMNENKNGGGGIWYELKQAMAMVKEVNNFLFPVEKSRIVH